MQHEKEQRVRKVYRRPELAAVTIELGVFGDYGCPDGRGKGGDGFVPDWLAKN